MPWGVGGSTSGFPPVEGVQGYLAHKNPPLLLPCSMTIPRVHGLPMGGTAVSYERGTPVVARETCRGVLEGVPQASLLWRVYRGTSLIRNSLLLGPYSMTVPGVLWWSYGGGLFLMSEVPLYWRTSGFSPDSGFSNEEGVPQASQIRREYLMFGVLEGVPQASRRWHRWSRRSPLTPRLRREYLGREWREYL